MQSEAIRGNQSTEAVGGNQRQSEAISEEQDGRSEPACAWLRGARHGARARAQSG